MKFHRLNQTGLAHYILPALVVVAIGLIGVRVLTASHADSPTVKITNTSSTSTTSSFYQILNYASAAQTTGVTQVSAQIQSLGAQTVDQLSPGAQLDLLAYGKTSISSECYYFQVLPLKGGGATATIAFGGIGASKTVNFTYNATYASFLQSFCVPTGKGATPSYNVENLSPSTGPDVLVYQDVVQQP